VGESYIVLAQTGTVQEGEQTAIPMRIAGVWQATDPQQEFWFYRPQEFKEMMFIPEQTFIGRISPYLETEVDQAVWYLVMDGSDVQPDNATALLSRITKVEQKAAGLLPNITLGLSPKEALERYWSAADLLTILLYAFSVPILGLTLAFIGMVAGLGVERQRNEIAMLRSRGATAVQILGIAILEGVLLGAVALIVGLPTGERIAYVIGSARSFLDFTAQPDLRVGVTTTALRLGLVVAGLAILAQVVPTIGAARHTIVSYKQEQARALRPPWWQRVWLDVLLLIPAAYGAYLLRRQGGIALPVGEGVVLNDPFKNPLLLLVPALGIFALTLFILRILPLITASIAWITARMGGVGILLATRSLSRTPGSYTTPLVLLVLTLSLSAFTASFAQTLDFHLYDQMYYEVGADMRLLETGRKDRAAGFGATLTGDDSSLQEEVEEEGPGWHFLPVSEYLNVPGVQAAARVGRYEATTRLSGGTQRGTFIGVDRLDFPQVAFWRPDFAPTSLGTLMNGLALVSNGVLVPRSFMAHHRLSEGDTFQAKANMDGQLCEIDLKIVGGFDLFPTWYTEEKGPLFVSNLDYLFERAGGQFPYNVWLRTGPNADYDQVAAGLREHQLLATWDAPLLKVARAQRQPERQGLFGLLSVGFMAAAVLTVLGFLLYAFFSFRRRFIEMGILRAVGLSSGQMIAFLAWELAFLILIGLVVGTSFGIWVSELFIPYLQVGADAAAQTPPFIVEIAWPAIVRIYTLFGLLFVVALLGLTALLMRMKIFQAIKLGETV
jgi:putative ABC transport system permease protein